MSTGKTGIRNYTSRRPTNSSNKEFTFPSPLSGRNTLTTTTQTGIHYLISNYTSRRPTNSSNKEFSFLTPLSGRNNHNTTNRLTFQDTSINKSPWSSKGYPTEAVSHPTSTGPGNGDVRWKREFNVYNTSSKSCQDTLSTQNTSQRTPKQSDRLPILRRKCAADLHCKIQLPMVYEGTSKLKYLIQLPPTRDRICQLAKRVPRV